MANMKYLYKDIFAISKEIEILIPLENFEKINYLLDQREILMQQICPEDATLGEIKEIIDRINKIDAKNIKQLVENKNDLGHKISSLSKNIKYLSSYKLENIYVNGVIDEKS